MKVYSVVVDMSEYATFQLDNYIEIDFYGIYDKEIDLKGRLLDGEIGNFFGVEGIIGAIGTVLHPLDPKYDFVFDGVQCIDITNNDSRSLTIVNPINIIDCWDESYYQNQAKNKKNSGRLHSYSFDYTMLRMVMLFKIPQHKDSIYCTENFYNQYMNNSLNGLEFRHCNFEQAR
jgi:hypothetical protein